MLEGEDLSGFQCKEDSKKVQAIQGDGRKEILPLVLATESKE